MEHMRKKIRQLTLLSILTASCLALQLTPRPPNFEFTSLITFITGVVFGGLAGITLGALVMFVNGFLSPYGFAGIILIFQMLGMAMIGFAGSLFKKLGRENIAKLYVEAAMVGAFLTLIYDVITNLGFAILFSVPIIPTLVAGITFSFMHIAYNATLFGFLAAPITYAIKKFLAGPAS